MIARPAVKVKLEISRGRKRSANSILSPAVAVHQSEANPLMDRDVKAQL